MRGAAHLHHPHIAATLLELGVVDAADPRWRQSKAFLPRQTELTGAAVRQRHRRARVCMCVWRRTRKQGGEESAVASAAGSGGYV